MGPSGFDCRRAEAHVDRGACSLAPRLSIREVHMRKNHSFKKYSTTVMLQCDQFQSVLHIKLNLLNVDIFISSALICTEPELNVISSRY